MASPGPVGLRGATQLGESGPEGPDAGGVGPEFRAEALALSLNGSCLRWGLIGVSTLVMTIQY